MESVNANNRRSWLVTVASILLVLFVLVEFFSNIGWSSSLTSNLQYPLNKIVSISIIVTSLLGIYGLSNRIRLGSYFALLASVFQVVLALLFILGVAGSSSLRFISLFQALVSLALGLVTTVFIFKLVEYSQVTRFASDLSVPNPQYTEYPLEIVDLTKIYDLGPTQVAAINGLNLKVRRGESIAIMGPSGSGKSTLLNLIGALDKPTSGHIYIDGVDISTLDDLGLAKLRNEKVGFVFQSYNLINRSRVLRNLELPAMVKGHSKDERLKKVQSLLQTVNLNDKINRRPKTLSGGEQQRVAIARALMNDPPIILADEPTGNLDSKTGHEIMAFLKKTSLEKNSTLIIVTHSREVGEMTDRIINIRDGIIVKEERLK
ncbi:MAG: transporter ATP-binding protein [Thermoproteota archaeon]|nr:transporter ATP-binding protein [Thermoproteota archaeon]